MSYVFSDITVSLFYTGAFFIWAEPHKNNKWMARNYKSCNEMCVKQNHLDVIFSNTDVLLKFQRKIQREKHEYNPI